MGMGDAVDELLDVELLDVEVLEVEGVGDVDGVTDLTMTDGSGVDGAGAEADSATADVHPATTVPAITSARASPAPREASTASSCAMADGPVHQTRRSTLTTLPMMLASSPRMGA